MPKTEEPQNGPIVPLILCGGSGSRLWPASRKHWPKQFLSLPGRPSLFQATLARVRAEQFGKAVVVTGSEHRFIVAEQAAAAGHDIDIILEPEARDSGPAFAVGAAQILRTWGADAVVLALAADHAIEDTEGFHACIQLALPTAREGRIVTFGVVPDEPSTAYGYIEAEGDDPVRNVSRFVEKPDPETARRFVRDGLVWNSGNFVTRADTLLDQYRVHDARTVEAAMASLDAATRDLDFIRLDAAAFAETSATSIDYAVMERTDLASVVTATFDWSDVGSWDAMGELFEQREEGNRADGELIALEATGNIVQSSGPLVVLAGVQDLVVSITDDAVLVTMRGRSDLMKTAVAMVHDQSPDLTTEHVRSYRPWGNYKSLDKGMRHQVKRIVVKPGGILSLQHHHHRAEHWVVVRGTARVTLNEETVTLHENESVYIPTGTVHRLENPGKIDLDLIEVQTGSYLGEDDIIRHEDLYARVETPVR